MHSGCMALSDLSHWAHNAPSGFGAINAILSLDAHERTIPQRIPGKRVQETIQTYLFPWFD